MRAPAEAVLLEAWDEAAPAGPTGRALALLGAAGVPHAEAAGWSIGRRDAAILALRRAVFGERLEGVADCPGCGARLEAVLLAEALAGPDVPGGVAVTVEAEGYAVTARPADSADLAALEAAPPGADLTSLLLRRCVLSATHEGRAMEAGALPPGVRAALDAALAGADPLGEAAVALTCPDCGHGWSALLDLADWTWREVDHWAARLLGEVHVLAGAYGWTEAEVLALSPRRRAHYRALVGR